MDDDRALDLDDDLFPACTPDTVGTWHTDEYGVTYISDVIEGLGCCWVYLIGSSPDGGG